MSSHKGTFSVLAGVLVVGGTCRSPAPNPERYTIVEKCTAAARHAHPSQGEQHLMNDRTC
jgi:hypothetical protein